MSPPSTGFLPINYRLGKAKFSGIAALWLIILSAGQEQTRRTKFF